MLTASDYIPKRFTRNSGCRLRLQRSVSHIGLFVPDRADINGKLVPFVCIIFLLSSLQPRFPFLGIPRERDAGEYAYAAQFILQGIAPYKLLAPQ